MSEARDVKRDFAEELAAWLGPVLAEVGLVAASDDERVDELCDLLAAEARLMRGPLVRAVAAGAGDRRALSSGLRTDLERHAAWLDGLHLGIGKELATWLVECPHYAALWKEQVDENARLRAALGDRPPAPSEAPRCKHYLWAVSCGDTSCDLHGAYEAKWAGRGPSVEREEDFQRMVLGAVRPTPRAALTVCDLARLLLETEPLNHRDLDAWAAALLPRLGAASPAAAPPPEEPK